MTVKYRFPGDVDIPTRFFARFTAKDLVRVGLPPLLGYAAAFGQPSITTVVAGVVIGAVWYLYRPYNNPVDVHLYHALRQLTGYRAVRGSDVADSTTEYTVSNAGKVVGVIEVEPTNLEMKTSDQQEALHLLYKDVLESIQHPVEIHSRQEPYELEAYIDEVDSGKEPKGVREDYIRYCRDVSEDTLVTTKHYLVVRVTVDSISQLKDRLTRSNDSEDDHGNAIEDAARELDKRCREIIHEIDGSELTAHRVTGKDLNTFLQRYDTSIPTPSLTEFHTRPSDDIGRYRKMAYLTEFPTGMQLAWPLDLLRINGHVDVVQVIDQQPPDNVTKQLQRRVNKISAEIQSFVNAGFLGTSKLEGLLDDTNWMLDRFTDREDKPFQYGVYITVHAEDRERCRKSFDKVRTRLDAQQIDYEAPVFRTDQAYKTDSVLYSDRLDETVLLPGSSVAAGFPFATQQTDADTGVIYGEDASDGTPVVMDRFDWSSHSMAVMGATGSGKSYMVKLELLRAWIAYDDLQVYVVDPKKEYKTVVNRLGEKQSPVFTLEEGKQYQFGYDVVGFQVDERGAEANADQLVDIVRQIYRHASQSDQKTLVVIDEARILMNHEEGRQVLNQFVLEARDTNTAITLVSQNASHFTHCREGREILDNMPGKVFMRHNRVPDDVVEYFQLSNREKQELFQLRTGTDASYSEAVVKIAGQLDAKLHIESTAAEHALIQ